MTEFEKKVERLQMPDAKDCVYAFAFGSISADVQSAKAALERGNGGLALSYLTSADMTREAVRYIKTGISDYV